CKYLCFPSVNLYYFNNEKSLKKFPLTIKVWSSFCSHIKLVDSHYCPSCLENMPSAEAKLKKNRCANCFDCPGCMHTLSTRATSISTQLPDDPAKTTMKKAYYLACGFCRWTSRDVGMADKSVASGGWQEPENPHTQRMNKLIEYYQQLAQKEKVERDRKKLARRRNYMPLAFSTVNFVDTQRLLQPDFQPVCASQLYPRHKHLLIKRSLRCRKCEHNLSKPEFNPTSIKFKIQLVAVNYIPEVRIMSIPNLRYMKESQVLLTLTNPVENLTHVTLLECEEGDPDDINSTAKVGAFLVWLIFYLPNTCFFFFSFHSIIAFRKANKVGIFIKVTPQREEGEVTVCFKMKHDFKNLAAPIRPIEESDQGTEVIWLTQHVELSLGPLLP
uniref:Dynactin subunit 4 n=1 Tax=Rhinopithecus bieti TaxID=61621 RepID=A0A2K6KW47_RHIBE